MGTFTVCLPVLHSLYPGSILWARRSSDITTQVPRALNIALGGVIISPDCCWLAPTCRAQSTGREPERIERRRAALIAYDVCRRALTPSDPARRAVMRPVLDAWVRMIATARTA